MLLLENPLRQIDRTNKSPTFSFLVACMSETITRYHYIYVVWKVQSGKRINVMHTILHRGVKQQESTASFHRAWWLQSSSCEAAARKE